jgi:hypothetical protein
MNFMKKIGGDKNIVEMFQNIKKDLKWLFWKLFWNKWFEILFWVFLLLYEFYYSYILKFEQLSF